MGKHYDRMRHKQPTRIPHGPADHARLKGTILYPGMFLRGGGGFVNPDPDNDGDNDLAGGVDTDNDRVGS